MSDPRPQTTELEAALATAQRAMREWQVRAERAEHKVAKLRASHAKLFEETARLRAERNHP